MTSLLKNRAAARGIARSTSESPKPAFSFGNSRRWNGLRINWQDNAVDQVNPWADASMASPSAWASFDGIHVGGLAVVGNGRVRGAAIGGLAVVSNGRISGLAVGGLAVVGSDGLVGVGIGGAHGVAQWIHGLAISPIRTRTWEMRGVSIAGYNRMKSDQFGLAIGVYNYARRLHGVQLGLINNARNNRGWRRVLPLFNVHLD